MRRNLRSFAVYAAQDDGMAAAEPLHLRTSATLNLTPPGTSYAVLRG
jgi:hypothetical protein